MYTKHTPTFELNIFPDPTKCFDGNLDTEGTDEHI